MTPRRQRPVQGAQMLGNLQAEQQLLGLMILEPQRIWEVDVGDGDWSSPTHQAIYDALVDLAVQGQPVDLAVLAHELRRRGQLDAVGGAAYLASLTGMAGYNAQALARVIRDCARRRRLMAAAQKLQALATDPSADPAAALAVVDEIADAVSDHVERHTASLRQAATERLAHLEQTRGRAEVEGVPTGFRDLDRWIGGMPRGELTVLAARPGMGKSAFAHQVAEHVARRGGRVLLCTPEMSRAQVADRFLARLGEVSIVAIRTRSVGERGWARLRAAVDAIPDGIELFDKGAMTTLDIAAEARRLHAQQPVELIVVDHLQYLADAPLPHETRAYTVGRMCKALKALARDLGCALLLCCQLSRRTEHRAERRPELADLRDSGEIEQDADIVLFLHRPSYYDPNESPGICEVGIAKQRNGPTGTLRLRWFDDRAMFADLHREEVPA